MFLTPFRGTSAKTPSQLFLESERQFQIANPIALQTKYLRFRDDQGVESMRAEMREEVKAAEQDAWDVLVNLFDWVDGLDSQPTMGAVHRHEEPQNIVSNVFMSLTEQMKQLRRKVKRKVQEGVRTNRGKLKSVPSCVGSDIRHGAPYHI